MVKKNAVRILVVDDDKPLRRIVKATLRSDGYRVFEAFNGQSALRAAVAVRPDAVILDLGLPDMNGIEITRQIRSRTSMPIIILSINEQGSDKVAALNAGADDYLTKPFNSAELLARLRAVMRRLIPQTKDEIFKTGELTFDIERRMVQIKNQPVQLTPAEYDILKALVLKAGKVVTNQQLFREVWNKEEGSGKVDHLLRVTVSNLRRKMEPDPARPTYILTEFGVGYRLNVE